MKPTANDIVFMKRALELALRGRGRVHPNPLVGAVLVKKGKIVGEGAHLAYGGPHAEVNAIRAAGGRARGATLYVTLEPCPHTGKTPPCSKLILDSGIKKVVVAAGDPNPLVSGKGLRELKRAGVTVVEGVLRTEAEAMNRDFARWIRTRKPYGVVKVAQSLDGKIATRAGESRWISGKPARRFAQMLRLASDAILVGVNTVLKDDPLLSVRGRHAPQPLKVIVDSGLRTPPSSRLFSHSSPGRILIAAASTATRSRLVRLRRSKAEIIFIRSAKGRVDLKALFAELGRRGIVRVLIEGGGEVIAGALAAGVVQEINFIVAPIFIGGRQAPGSVAGEGTQPLSKAVKIRRWRVTPLGQDFLVQGEL